MSTGYEYFDAVTERLSRQPITQSHRMSAIAVLQYIARHLKWNGYHCEKTAGELAELSGFDRSQMSRILKTLEDVGAIYRVTVGREKAIVVNPEGIFRGKVSDHQDVTARFKFDVIDGGKGRAA